MINCDLCHLPGLQGDHGERLDVVGVLCQCCAFALRDSIRGWLPEPAYPNGCSYVIGSQFADEIARRKGDPNFCFQCGEVHK
jgi:hypothetical protein